MSQRLKNHVQKNTRPTGTLVRMHGSSNLQMLYQPARRETDANRLIKPEVKVPWLQVPNPPNVKMLTDVRFVSFKLKALTRHWPADGSWVS